MASPASLPELDPESDDELSRISVMVGELLIDVGVPTRVSISAVVNDIVDLANQQLRAQASSDVEFDNTEGKWTFARLTGDLVDPDQSLWEAGVSDGEVLVVQEALGPARTLLIEDVEGTSESDDRWPFTGFGPVAGPLAVSIALSAAVALLLPSLAAESVVRGVPIAALAVLAVGIGCSAMACLLPYRSSDRRASARLAGVALPLLFGASFYVVPGVTGFTALPMALAVTALVALVVLLISGRGLSLFTAVITLAVLGIAATVAVVLWAPSPRAAGALLATVSVAVVYLAPRATIMLARLEVPRVPTAGEPLDAIETQGGTAVEGVNAVGKQVIPTEAGMADRVGRAREHLTGIIAAAAVLAAVGCYFALDTSNGFFWQGTLFAAAVATVMCLRGRSHHDLAQSAVLIGGGLVIALVVIIKTATFVNGWQLNAAVALVALTVLVVLCGLVAPQRQFSPVMRRWVEIAELLAIGVVFPLACWIMGLYAFFRELRL